MPSRLDSSVLTDKRVAIVGGSSGVGLALARRVTALGAQAILLARDAGKLKAAADEVPRSEVRCLDLRRPETLAPALAALGSVAHLVVTAGTFNPSPVADSEPDDWRSILEERLIGPLSVIRLLASRITTSIVLFSGTIGRRPAPGCALLAAATAGIEGAARTLALELAPVRVNVVAPGMLDTPMLDKVLSSQKSRICADLATRLPARRIGTADDAAGAALFLMTNSYMTGSTVEIDGGGQLI